MSPVWWFPLASIALNLCSAAMFAMVGNWKGTVYWLAAVVLTWVANGAIVGLAK
jgi:hypothetical protein